MNATDAETPNELNVLEETDFLNDLEEEHRTWLSAFDPRYLRNFGKLRNASYEAAMTEAGVRRWLQSHGVVVEPAEDLTGAKQSPDFFCTKGDYEFFVEVTNITIQKVVEETHLPYVCDGTAQNYLSLNDAFWSACRGKAAQCGALAHPALVAVGTFHRTATTLCLSKPHLDMLLTGETLITWQVNAATGEGVAEPYLSTELRSAAFLRPDRSIGVGFARNSVSGLLVCGDFDCKVPTVLGVLHPNPTNAFAPGTFSGVSFCEVEIDRSTGHLSTMWDGKPTDYDDDEEE